MRKLRGPSHRLTPAEVAVAAELRLADFATLHALSPRTVRGFLADGLPHFRYPGKITIPREEGAQWLARFRSDRVARLVDEVLDDLRPLTQASRRLRAVSRPWLLARPDARDHPRPQGPAVNTI